MRLGSALRKFAHRRPAPWLFCAWPQSCEDRSRILSIREAARTPLGTRIFILRAGPVVRSRHMTIPERVSIRDIIGYRLCRRILAAAHFIKRDLVTRAGVSDSHVDVVGEGANLEESILTWTGENSVMSSDSPESPPFRSDRDAAPEKGQRTFIKRRRQGPEIDFRCAIRHRRRRRTFLRWT